MKSDPKIKVKKRKKLASVLGLALDGSKLDGVVLRRTNGAVQKLQSFSAQLTLDPLTAAPELVGREIRNQLDAAGVRERHCVFGVPLKWVLAAQTELPPLPEADLQSLLQLEVEKGFHADAAELQVSNSRCALAGDKQFVLLAAVPTAHVAALEKVLAAAKLKPVSFALGVAALQPPDEKSGVMALLIGESNVRLQITVAGGVAALRALEGAIENEAGRKTLHTDVVAREARVTLGQLPVELRNQLKTIRVFGPKELAQQLADEMDLRFEAVGLKVEAVSAYAPNEFGVTLPPDASVSPAFSLAARLLAGQAAPFEFLPPKPTLVEQFVARYSSGRLRTTGAIAVGVALIFIGIVAYQQIRLAYLRSQWAHMKKQVAGVQYYEDQIRQYKPWYGGDYRSLAILRALSLAFPESGVVTVKTISVREDGTVNCSGNYQDNSELLTVQAKLAKIPGVTDVHYEQGHGNKVPLQFAFSFKYTGGQP